MPQHLPVVKDVSHQAASDILTAADLEHSFEDTGRLLYKGLSFNLAQGSTTALMGRSGIGKSTLARRIAGIDNGTGGTVRWNGSVRRGTDVAFVDQDPMNSVFPWQKALRNITYPLQRLGWSRAGARGRAEHMLQLFGLADLAHAYPRSLSGGERQRLALGRSAAWKPKVLILDEVFAALDDKTRSLVTTALRELTASEGATILFVTHSLTDVLRLADACLVMGDAPARIVATLPLELPYPREMEDPRVQEAQARCLEVLRHGYL